MSRSCTPRVDYGGGDPTISLDPGRKRRRRPTNCPGTRRTIRPLLRPGTPSSVLLFLRFPHSLLYLHTYSSFFFTFYSTLYSLSYPSPYYSSSSFFSYLFLLFLVPFSSLHSGQFILDYVIVNTTPSDLTGTGMPGDLIGIQL